MNPVRIVQSGGAGGSSCKKLSRTDLAHPLSPVQRANSSFFKKGFILLNPKSSLDLQFSIENPMRWDVDHPHLHQIVHESFGGNSAFLEVDEGFGIRSFKWTVDDGFHLNGRRLQIYGVNLHHDHGPLGAAFSSSDGEASCK